MKIFFSLLLTLGMATPALAQGKVNFINDSLHLVYWAPALGGEAYLAGQGGITLTIELWAGTSSSSLSLQATTDFGGQSSPGRWAGRTVTMPSVPAGSDFFDIIIYDVAAGSYSNAVLGGFLSVSSGLFTAMASGGTPYYSIVQHTTPASSTWADGTWNMDPLSPGYRGALMLGMPEPSVFSLSGLGLAMLLIFSPRRK